MKTKYTQYAILFVLALAVITAGIAIGQQPAQAGPMLAPTPVADTVVGPGRAIVFQSATALTADTNTSGVDLLEWSTLDGSITIDQGSTVNTTTVTIQYSNDNSNWDNGTTLVSANAADATEISRFPIFGRYVRFNQDVTNSEEVTITLRAVAR